MNKDYIEFNCNNNKEHGPMYLSSENDTLIFYCVFCDSKFIPGMESRDKLVKYLEQINESF